MMLFKSKPKLIIERSVGATLYPDRIIIETRNKKDEYTWYSTDEVSIIPLDANDQIIGEAIHKHMNSSKMQDVSFEEIKQFRDGFKKATGLKTEKAIQQDAKYVSLYLTNGQLRFEPFKNKLHQKSFYRLPENIFSIEPENLFEIVNGLRKAWNYCSIE